MSLSSRAHGVAGLHHASRMMSLFRSDWALLVVPGVIWGASFLFIAEGLKALGPNGVAFTRIVIGFATLAMFPSARRPMGAEGRLRIALLGLLWFALPLTLFPFAEQRVTSALTGMLNGAVPLFTALVAALVTRRAPSRAIAIGLAVGLLGAILVALPSVGAGGSSTSGVPVARPEPRRAPYGPDPTSRRWRGRSYARR